jgi:hypothetical protein
VCVYGVRWFVVGGRPRVPNHEFLVVCDGAKEGLVQQVPGNVLYDGGVAGENGLGVDNLRKEKDEVIT